MIDRSQHLDGGNLLSQAIAGDRLALGQLLLRHGPALKSHITRKIPLRFQPVCSPADVVQETYRVAIIKFPGWDGTSERAFATWLARIADFACQRMIAKLDTLKRGGNWRCAPELSDSRLQSLSTSLLGRPLKSTLIPEAVCFDEKRL